MFPTGVCGTGMGDESVADLFCVQGGSLGWQYEGRGTASGVCDGGEGV